MSIGAAIGLGMASYQLALQQQACFNQLQGLYGIGQSQLCGIRNYKTEFDNSFDEMREDFDSYLKDWESPTDC